MERVLGGLARPSLADRLGRRGLGLRRPCPGNSSVNRLRQTIAAQGSAFRHHVPVVDQGPRVYMVLPVTAGVTPEVRRFVTDAAHQASSTVGATVVAGIGTCVTHAGAVSESRIDADRTLRVLLRDPGTHGTVAWLPDVLPHATLLEILDVLRERPHLQRSRIDALRADPRNSPLIETLHAYLAHFGSVSAAAEAMRIHPNTFRYRLKRAVQLTGIDLEDHVERLMVGLLLEING